MKKLIILILAMCVAGGSFAQESKKTRDERIREILERNNGNTAEQSDWDKAEKEFQRIHRKEARHSNDTFYKGRDTLYLLFDPTDSLQTYDTIKRNITWVLFQPKAEEWETEDELCRFGLEVFMRKTFQLENKTPLRKVLTKQQLSGLHPAGRKETIAFFNRECTRAKKQNARVLPAWGVWDLQDYFETVYIIIPEKEDMYEFYPCGGE